MKISILIPVYNDWESVSELIKNLDIEVKGLNHEFSIIIINDASLEKRSVLNESYKIYFRYAKMVSRKFSTINC